MTQIRTNVKSHGQRGFSLVETLIVALLLVIVIAIATESMIQLQKRSSADAAKTDTTQMARQFMDQIVNDLHQTGYPGAKLYDPASAPSANNIAAGLLLVNQSEMQFEADVDGSGNVSHVWLQLLWSNGTAVSAGAGTCPCTLQRGTLYKSLVGSTAVPYYTELNNATNTNIFTAYLFDGTEVALPASASDLPNIKNVKMTVNLQSTVKEIDGSTPEITMATEAKINN